MNNIVVSIIRTIFPMNEARARKILSPYINEDDTISDEEWWIEKHEEDDKYYIRYYIASNVQLALQGVAGSGFPRSQKDLDALNWWIENKCD